MMAAWHGPAAADAWVNHWIGAPFVWDGRTREGVDCWGLVWCAYRDLEGVDLPDWRATGHSARWRAQSFTQGRKTLWRPAQGQIDPIRLHVALVARANAPHHIGLLWRRHIVHAAEGVGVAATEAGQFAKLFGTPEIGTLATEALPCRAA